MKLHRIAAVATLGSLLSLPLSLAAQEYALLQHVSQSAHDRAEREQTEKDHRNHTGAKIVGGSAAGGAVVGALAGGGKGALIGGAVGAGGGAIANKVRKDKAVKKREQRESEYHHNNHDYPHEPQRILKDQTMGIYSNTMLGNARSRLRGAATARTAGAISSAPAGLDRSSHDGTKCLAGDAIATPSSDSTHKTTRSSSGRHRTK